VLASAARSNELLVEVETVEERDEDGHRIIAQRLPGKVRDGALTDSEDESHLTAGYEGLSKDEKSVFHTTPVTIDLRQNREGRDAKGIVLAAVQAFEKALVCPTEDLLQSTVAVPSAAATLTSRPSTRPERKLKRAKKLDVRRKTMGTRGRVASKAAWTHNDENLEPLKRSMSSNGKQMQQQQQQQQQNSATNVAPWDGEGELDQSHSTAPAAFAGIDQVAADSLLDEHIFAMERQLMSSQQPVSRPRASWLTPNHKGGGSSNNYDEEPRSMKRSQSAPAAKRNGRGLAASKVRGPNAALEERRLQEQSRQLSGSANQGEGPGRTSLRREVEIQRQVAQAKLIAAESGYTRTRVRRKSGSFRKPKGKMSSGKAPIGDLGTPASERIYKKYERAMSPPRRSKEDMARIAKIAGF
jgi:hypothetical protein